MTYGDDVAGGEDHGARCVNDHQFHRSEFRTEQNLVLFEELLYRDSFMNLHCLPLCIFWRLDLYQPRTY